MSHVCDLPRWKLLGRKFLCRACNTEWVCERYIRWKVWKSFTANGKAVRR